MSTHTINGELVGYSKQAAETAADNYAAWMLAKKAELAAETSRAETAEAELRETSAELIGAQARLAEATALLGRFKCLTLMRSQDAGEVYDASSVDDIADELAAALRSTPAPSPEPAAEPMNCDEVWANTPQEQGAMGSAAVPTVRTPVLRPEFIALGEALGMSRPKTTASLCYRGDCAKMTGRARPCPVHDAPTRPAEPTHGHVSHEEARAILSRFNASHFNNPGEHARYSIPARPEHDDDLKLARYIDQNRARDAEPTLLERIEAELDSSSADIFEAKDEAAQLRVLHISRQNIRDLLRSARGAR